LALLLLLLGFAHICQARIGDNLEEAIERYANPVHKASAAEFAIYIFPLCVLLVFLVLAAQCESLRLPLAIVLIVPLCLLFALLGFHRWRR
jgi:hypothetical protein